MTGPQDYVIMQVSFKGPYTFSLYCALAVYKVIPNTYAINYHKLIGHGEPGSTGQLPGW